METMDHMDKLAQHKGSIYQRVSQEMGKIHRTRKCSKENMVSKSSLDDSLLSIEMDQFRLFQLVSFLVSKSDMEEFSIKLCYVY